jgi:hypothetical protein
MLRHILIYLKYHLEPLPDIILDNVSYQQWGLDVSEILIMVSTFSAFMIAMLHSYRYLLLPRGLFSAFMIAMLHSYRYLLLPRGLFSAFMIAMLHLYRYLVLPRAFSQLS